MNYLKGALYGFVFTLLFYPLVEICSANGRFFDPSYFSLTGFVATAVYATLTIYFVVYSLEFARKKDAAQNTGG